MPFEIFCSTFHIFCSLPKFGLTHVASFCLFKLHGGFKFKETSACQSVAAYLDDPVCPTCCFYFFPFDLNTLEALNYIVVRFVLVRFLGPLCIFYGNEITCGVLMVFCFVRSAFPIRMPVPVGLFSRGMCFILIIFRVGRAQEIYLVLMPANEADFVSKSESKSGSQLELCLQIRAGF